MATSKKSTPWSTEEVTTFLNLIGDDKIQQELDGTMRNVKVFQDVSAQMSERGFSRTFLQCREKLKKMKSEYRQVKDNNNTSGAGRKQWKWFDLSDQIYGHRPANVGREGGLDSATALLESLQDDYIGTSEEEHSRTTGDGSVPSTTSSSNPERTPARPQTPAEESTPTQPPTPSAITTPQRVVLGKRKRGGEDRAQQERHLDWAKASAERRWELDAAVRREEAVLRREEAVLRREEAVLRREEAAQAETFNLAFLRTLGEVLGGLGSRRGSRRGPSPP
ncbi:zinc finger and SCAN domain-containing protein 29-like isoform X2 [Gymnodraco acuticeps]|uniref:Zinc finger and SCAN domain-containing protein 29-like isoform X2 n=1 Tax=Gymnodraco acuticeps TaxID=8218 RepID=A0A6P8VXR2_GYMAC|nr:zinc finger and SCAN domain-containing protein 29-like isoform X2 [Gymnodraco acuticeps]